MNSPSEFKLFAVLLLISIQITVFVVSYKIPDLENNCHYLDTGKQQYHCRHFNLSQYKDEPIDINYDGYAAFTHASNLIFTECSLPRMPKNYFGAFPRVQNITIVDCELELDAPLTPPYDVQRLLKTVVLRGNHISELSGITFQGVRNLQYLDLSQNRISNITGVFAYTESLEHLHMHSNQISSIENKEFSRMKKLKMINLSGNLLTVIPNLFETNEQLTEINFSNNKITKFDAKLLSSTTKLEIFNMSRNQIEAIPDDFFKNTPLLTKLDLQQNKIKSLSSNSFDQLTSLTFLSLANNEISNFGVSYLKNLKKLATLYLQRNEISTFDTGASVELFTALQNLVTFDISNNPKTKPTNQTCLDIKLQQLNFPRLMRLNLSSTNFCNLTYNTFTHYKDLRTLDLSNNNLEKLDWHTMLTFNRLRELDVSNNRMSQLDYNNTKIFTDGFKIDLMGNQWNCTYLANMIKYFSEKYIEYLPPWHYQPKSVSSIAGIECNGEVDNVLTTQDKAEETLEREEVVKRPATNDAVPSCNNNNGGGGGGSTTFVANFDGLAEKLTQVFKDNEKETLHVKLNNIDEFKESISANFSFIYFLAVIVLIIVLILSVWNFMTIRTLRNMAKIQQRVSFEANLLDNIQV